MRRLVPVVLSCVLGLAYAFAVVGPRVINPFDVSWLDGDPATAYLGWAFFRREPHLTLPMGWSQAIGYPLGEPVAYLDSIPLPATIGWIVSNYLPDDFQYLGIYFVLCCALQFYFGFRLSRRLCAGSAIAGTLGGCLFLTAPAFTFRAFGHFALTSHWLLLAALDELVGMPARSISSPPKGARPTGARPTGVRITRRAGLCFVAGGINPYICVMTVLIMCGAYLRDLLCGDKAVARLCIGLGLALLAAVSALGLFGFLRTGDASQYGGTGYGMFSMNLLAPVDPEGYGGLLFGARPIEEGQYEGYNYLGLGILVLAAVAIAARPASLCALLLYRNFPAGLIFFMSLLLAMSLTGKVGHLTLWRLEAPQPVMAALTSLRSSGRLFWPGYYLVFIGTIAAACKAFQGRSLQVALAVALAIQFFDLAGLRAAVREQWWSSSAPSVPPTPAWHDIGRTQRHLVVVPAWQCAASPAGFPGYAIFGRLALEQHMTINSFYAGRYSDEQLDYFCDEQIAELRASGLRDGSAYVFKGTMTAGLIGMPDNGQYCTRVDEYTLCSSVPGRSGLDPAILRDVVRLHSGDVVRFSEGNDTADRLVGLGWSEPQEWGRAMGGHAAGLAFKVPVPTLRDVRIEISVVPLAAPSYPPQRVSASANGEPVGNRTFSERTEAGLGLVIPAGVVARDGLVQLRFDLPDAVAPVASGLHPGLRAISLGVTQMRVDDAGN